jgi:ribosomal protein L37AE/L43A
MLANRNLSRAIADVGFFEFRRQVRYKAAMAGSRVLVADSWFPSTKLCSACGAKNGALTLSERIWTCASCGTSQDRDVNAARNLARYAESSPASACGAEGTHREDDRTRCQGSGAPMLRQVLEEVAVSAAEIFDALLRRVLGHFAHPGELLVLERVELPAQRRGGSIPVAPESDQAERGARASSRRL